MEKIKRNKCPIIIAMIQWFVTTVLQFDRAFFTYEQETKTFIVVKILYFFFLIIAWCFGLDVLKKIKAGNADYQRASRIFMAHFSILMILLLILWPGTWAWDDLGVLNGIRCYEGFYPWQHIITGIYQDVMLQILPFPGGIIFLQNIIISLCVAFSVSKFEKAYNLKRMKNFYVDIMLKVIPFFLPPVLMYQFSGYRMGLYVYVELVMLVILICAIKDSEEWSWSYLALFCFLGVVVCSWRTESFLYLPFILVLLLFVNKIVLSRIKRIACFVLLIMGFWGMNLWQNHELGNDNYKIISLIGPCAELVRAADAQADAELLAAVDKVVSLQTIYDNPDIHGEQLYWSKDVVRDAYIKEDYDNYLNAVVKLSLKYPKAVIAERGILFLGSIGIGETVTNVLLAARLFDENNENNNAELVLSRDLIANTPVFKNIRKAAISILGGRRPDGNPIGILQKLIWNAAIPMVFLLYGWLKLLLQKKWYLWLICTAVIIRIPVVILTQPANWFMYFLSFYFLGYVLAVYLALIQFSRPRGQTSGIDNQIPSVNRQ